MVLKIKGLGPWIETHLFGISVEYGLKLRHFGAKSIEISLETMVVIQAQGAAWHYQLLQQKKIVWKEKRKHALTSNGWTECRGSRNDWEISNKNCDPFEREPWEVIYLESLGYKRWVWCRMLHPWRKLMNPQHPPCGSEAGKAAQTCEVATYMYSSVPGNGPDH